MLMPNWVAQLPHAARQALCETGGVYGDVAWFLHGKQHATTKLTVDPGKQNIWAQANVHLSFKKVISKGGDRDRHALNMVSNTRLRSGVRARGH